MNDFKKEVLNYNVVHGRTAIQYFKDRDITVSIDPSIYIYTIVDKMSTEISTLDMVKINNNKINYVLVDQYIKWETKIAESIKHIKENYDSLPEYILYVDGFDVMFGKDITNPKEMLDFYDCKILFNGEHNFGHTGFEPPYEGYFSKLYEHEFNLCQQLNQKKYGVNAQKSLNAGVFLGEKKAVLELLEETYEYMMQDSQKGFPYGCKDDQCLLKYMHNKHFDTISVDFFNRYFLFCNRLTFLEDTEEIHHFQFYNRFKHLYKQ